MKEIIVKDLLSIDEKIIREDGSLRLTEAKILSKNQVTIWVNSGEAGCHNIPHVHASFSNKEYSIAIDGTNKLLAPNKEDKFYRFIVKCYFKTFLQRSRDYWNNKTDSRMKFDINSDGVYLSSYSIK